MAVVRCPKCGAQNVDGHRRTARCRACHEPLGKCRYCRSCDLQIQDCVNLARREVDHLVDLDEVADCPDFSSRLVAAPSRGGRRMLAAAALLLTVCVAAFAALYLARAAARPVPGSPLELRATGPETVLQDEGFDLVVTAANVGERDLTGLDIRVAGKGMLALTCQSVTPPESYYDSARGSVTARVETLSPGDQCQLVFHFLPQRPGELSLLVSATAEGMEGGVVQSVESEVIP